MRTGATVLFAIGGAHYDAQWRAAIAARLDRVMVTSWNEWYENTHIELSERYGSESAARRHGLNGTAAK
jgi:hypothetical protein